jgi:hybrid cluster-associated redox disulfide protein
MTAADAMTTAIDTVLQACPAAAGVLVERGMACAGCPFSRFDTVAEVATAYGCDAAELANALVAGAVSPRTHDAGVKDHDHQ